MGSSTRNLLILIDLDLLAFKNYICLVPINTGYIGALKGPKVEIKKATYNLFLSQPPINTLNHIPSNNH